MPAPMQAATLTLALMQEYTNYHFEVAPAHLKGALDRFAQFFIAPLCKAGARPAGHLPAEAGAAAARAARQSPCSAPGRPVARLRCVRFGRPVDRRKGTRHMHLPCRCPGAGGEGGGQRVCWRAAERPLAPLPAHVPHRCVPASHPLLAAEGRRASNEGGWEHHPLRQHQSTINTNPLPPPPPPPPARVLAQPAAATSTTSSAGATPRACGTSPRAPASTCASGCCSTTSSTTGRSA